MSVLRIVSWNIAGRESPWRALIDMAADIALLQEAKPPPPDVAPELRVDEGPWLTPGNDGVRPWRAAVVQLSTSLEVQWLRPAPLKVQLHRTSSALVDREHSLSPESSVSRADPSMLRLCTGSGRGRTWLSNPSGSTLMPSVHREISDLSMLNGSQARHRVIAAGDLNVLNGYGEYGSSYWQARYASIFSRADSLGLSFVGPQFPFGRQPEPWPDELPVDS